MKPMMLQVRKRRMGGLTKAKRGKLTGAIYLPSGNVGKKMVVIPMSDWKSMKKSLKETRSAMYRIRCTLVKIGYAL